MIKKLLPIILGLAFVFSVLTIIHINETKFNLATNDKLNLPVAETTSVLTVGEKVGNTIDERIANTPPDLAKAIEQDLDITLDEYYRNADLSKLVSNATKTIGFTPEAV
jgi:hypothetical protein